MALPRVNDVLKFSIKIPSTGQTVRYRPYLVKEEKVLLQAFESRDAKACMQAMCDTIESCLDPSNNLSVSKLATFDLEYLFLKIRSKSVGESSDIIIRCQECQEGNDYSVDLDSITIEVNDNDNIVDITDDIKVEMQYPTPETLMRSSLSDDESQDPLEILSDCIAAVHTAEERVDCSNESKTEVIEFLSSLTATQLKNISDHVELMPALTHDISLKCKSCGADNNLTLKGLTDFF